MSIDTWLENTRLEAENYESTQNECLACENTKLDACRNCQAEYEAEIFCKKVQTKINEL